MKRPLIAVFGAAGRQGAAQVRQLHAAGYRIRALSRRADPFLGESYDNVEVMPADIADDASMKAAVSGVDGVFYTHPLRSPDRVEWVTRIGAASASAGVGRVVWNTSSWIPDRPGEPGTYGNNTKAINALWRSGAPATVFGSVLFMDNLLTNFAFPSIARDGKFVYAQRPDLEANWISLDDVAMCMVAALDRPDLEGAWMNIGGPERLTPVKVAAILSGVLGKPMPYEALTPHQFGRVLADAFGDEMSPEAKDATAQHIGDFYVYNNTAPTRPFEVDFDAMRERLPEVEFETMGTWAARQDWTWSNRPRPPVG